MYTDRQLRNAAKDIDAPQWRRRSSKGARDEVRRQRSRHTRRRRRSLGRSLMTCGAQLLIVLLALLFFSILIAS